MLGPKTLISLYDGTVGSWVHQSIQCLNGGQKSNLGKQVIIL